MKRTLDAERTCLRIRDLCREKNVSVEQIADMLNISKQAVYAWLKVRKLPTTDHLVEISDILNVTVDDLIVKKEYQL